MRNKPSQLKYEAYSVLALTDPNATPRPFYRVQSLEWSSDYSTETLLELANEGYVQIKENTPVVSLTLGGNQVAKEIDDTVSSEITGLHWTAALSNGDSLGTQNQVVFSIGKTAKYHISGGNSNAGGVAYAADGDDAIMNFRGSSASVPTDVTSAGATDSVGVELKTPNKDKKMIIRHVGFSLLKVNTGALAGYVYAVITTAAGAIIAESNQILATSLPANFYPTNDLTVFTFPEDVYLNKNTTYNVGITTNGYTYGNGATEINIEGFTATGAGNAVFSTDKGGDAITWAEQADLSLIYTLGWEWDLSDFDVSYVTKEIDTTDATIDPESARNIYNNAVDVLVPIRGMSELQRVLLVHASAINSVSWDFNVDGVATYEVGMEADNHSLFTGDRKVVDIASHEVTSGEQTAKIVDLSATFSEIWEIYKNGEMLHEAASATDLNATGVHKWTQSAGIITFSESTIYELDAIRVAGNPVTDPTWASYRLVSEPGDQGGLYKGEMDISLITNTSRPRVIEGLKVVNPSGDNFLIEILPGTCYLKNSTTKELELFRLYESFYFRITEAVASYYILLSMQGEVPTISALVSTSAENIDEYDLILALVTSDGAKVSAIVEGREWHRSRMGLIQSSGFSADLGREVIEELGNENVVERNLTKPVTVSVDVTAKDSDEELNVLIHEPRTVVKTQASANGITYTATTLAHAGVGSSVTAGDIIVARGSKAIVSAVAANTLTLPQWFGDIPPARAGYTIYKGILKASELDDNIGIQVNLYTSNDRDEYDSTGLLLGDKRIVVETAEARTASDSISIATGGSGEMSFTVNSDNLRAFYVAQAL